MSSIFDSLCRKTINDEPILQLLCFFLSEECHYEKQYKFVEGLNHIKVDFYYHTDSVIHDINNDYGLGFDDIPKLNHTIKLFNSVDNDLVKQLYKEDYDLIEAVKFKNR